VLSSCADPKLTQVFYLPCPNIGQGKSKVITMEMLGRIRRMHMRDKVSLHEIAKRTGLSRNTVRRWLRTPEEVQEPVYKRTPGYSKLSGYVTELEQSLKADAQRPKQNRRTARALFVQIQASGTRVATPVLPTSSGLGAPMLAKVSKRLCR